MLLGSFFGLLTALSIVIASMYYEKLGKKIDVLTLNLVRFALALFFITITSFLFTGSFFPLDLDKKIFTFLVLGGVLGTFAGECLYIKGILYLGVRTSLLVMTSTPIITALLSNILLHEDLKNLPVIFIILSGVFLTLNTQNKKHKENPKYKLGYFYISLAILAQSLANVTTRAGAFSYSPVWSTQIKLFAALISTLVLLSIRKKGKALTTLKGIKGNMLPLSTAAFIGPYLGTFFAMTTFKYTNAGIASTLFSTTPIISILISKFILDKEVGKVEVYGSGITLLGLLLFFLH